MRRGPGRAPRRVRDPHRRRGGQRGRRALPGIGRRHERDPALGGRRPRRAARRAAFAPAGGGLTAIASPPFLPSSLAFTGNGSLYVPHGLARRRRDHDAQAHAPGRADAARAGPAQGGPDDRVPAVDGRRRHEGDPRRHSSSASGDGSRRGRAGLAGRAGRRDGRAARGARRHRHDEPARARARPVRALAPRRPGAPGPLARADRARPEPRAGGPVHRARGRRRRPGARLLPRALRRRPGAGSGAVPPPAARRQDHRARHRRHEGRPGQHGLRRRSRPASSGCSGTAGSCCISCATRRRAASPARATSARPG